MTIIQHPHRRRNALTGEWVLVSPQRTQRPWQGKQESIPPSDLPAHDPRCYLCPGNTRANGEPNPDYKSTFVFTNDFPALLPEGDAGIALPETNSSPRGDAPFFQQETVSGISRVICYSPRHNLTLGQLPVDGIRAVVDTWATETAMLGKTYRWVQVFENKGEMMGCSNPHPHGQIWTGSSLPNEPHKEHTAQQAYCSTRESILLEDYAAEESKQKERVVVENDDWLAVVPYWAVWPFELLLLPRTHILRLPDLHTAQRISLAEILKSALSAYDALFEVSFPYSMGWHGAPFESGTVDHWQLHAHIFPPLLRSATVRKFMVGYEMFAEPQRDVTPESAAELVRRAALLTRRAGTGETR
jgi:UDPglucose--hexose-1-phosphate uridylyltransferase